MFRKKGRSAKVTVGLMCCLVVLFFYVSASFGVEKKVITALGWDQMATQFLGSAVNLFEKRHPDVKFNLLNMGAQEAMNKYVTGMSTGVGMPDIFINDPDWQALYLSIGGVLDVSEAVLPYKDVILPGTWELIAVKDGIWRFPLAYNPNLIYYRKDIFDKFGVTAPTDWAEDFIRVAEKICQDHDGDGKIDHYLGEFAGWMTILWFIGREQNIEDGYDTPMFNTPVALETLEWFGDAVKKGYFRYGNFMQPEHWELIKRDVCVAQPAPFWFQGHGLKRMGYRSGLEGKWRIARWPTWRPGEVSKGGGHGCGGWGVWSGTKYPNLCMELLEWFMTPAGGVNICLTRGLGPVTSEVTNVLKPINDWFYGDQKIWELIGDQAAIPNKFQYGENFHPFIDCFAAAVERIVEKDMPVVEALKMAEKEAISAIE